MEDRSHYDSAIRGIDHDGQKVNIDCQPVESPDKCDKKYGTTSKSSGRNIYCDDESALVNVSHSQDNPGYDYECQNVNLHDITKDETRYGYRGDKFAINCGEGRALNSLETQQHPIIPGKKKYAYQCGDVGKPDCRKPTLPRAIRIDILPTPKPVVAVPKLPIAVIVPKPPVAVPKPPLLPFLSLLLLLLLLLFQHLFLLSFLLVLLLLVLLQLLLLICRDRLLFLVFHQ